MKKQRSNYAGKVKKRTRIAKVLKHAVGTPFPAMGIQDSTKPLKAQIKASDFQSARVEMFGEEFARAQARTMGR